MEKQLMERDWRFMLDAVYRVNSAGSVEILEREALECLDALIPSTQGTFFIAEEDERGHSVYRRAVVMGAQARFMDEFLSGDYDKDPYFRGMQLIPRRRLSGTPTCFRRATGKIASSTRIYTNRRESTTPSGRISSISISSSGIYRYSTRRRTAISTPGRSRFSRCSPPTSR